MRPTIRALVTGLMTACGGTSPTIPSALPLSETTETAAYVFQYTAGDRVDAVWQQAYHEWAVATLQVSVPRRVTYHKYVSRTHMGDLTGPYTTNGFAEPEAFAIHTLWPRDNH